jgi:hypothetical protein
VAEPDHEAGYGMQASSTRGGGVDSAASSARGGAGKSLGEMKKNKSLPSPPGRQPDDEVGYGGQPSHGWRSASVEYGLHASSTGGSGSEHDAGYGMQASSMRVGSAASSARGDAGKSAGETRKNKSLPSPSDAQPNDQLGYSMGGEQSPPMRSNAADNREDDELRAKARPRKPLPSVEDSKRDHEPGYNVQSANPSGRKPLPRVTQEDDDEAPQLPPRLPRGARMRVAFFTLVGC